MRKKIYFCLLLVLILEGCISNSKDDETKTQEKEVSRTMNYPYNENYRNDSIRSIKLEKALKYGDTVSYSSVSKDYSLGGGKDEFMYYSIVMANKYENSGACFDAYLYFDRLLKYDKKFKPLANYYLIKGFLKGDKSAALEVRVKFGDIDTAKLINYLDNIDRVLGNFYLE